MKVLICFGTRPEAIKMVPLIYEFRRLGIPFKVCVTAQHREMLDQVLIFFQITPDHDLDLMEPNQSLNKFSGSLLLKIDEIIDLEEPDLVLVHGDTTSSVIIAFAAFHKNIKVAHIEAGLRTYNKKAPFPEEVNRQLTARIADYHFAPTLVAASNLKREQIPEDQIYLTGNTVVDAVEIARNGLNALSVPEGLSGPLSLINPSKRLILVTGHRRENFGKGIADICEALVEISKVEDVEIIYPVHLNPQVQKPVQRILGHHSNILLVPPVTYPELLLLIQMSSLIISDSGGIQEEAPVFGKKVLVTREFSERMEGVDSGFSILVGTDKEKIKKEAMEILNFPPDLSGEKNPFGDGKAAKRIVKILQQKIDSKVI